MKKKKNIVLGLITAGILIIVASTVFYWLLSWVLDQFAALDKEIALGLLTAATTVIVATATVVLGRYFERKRDIEAHFREKKIEIYDDFLKEFFKLFDEVKSAESGREPEDLAPFLREWQRKLILWGGQNVLRTYIGWMRKVQSGEPDARTLWLTEDFIRAVRKDLGHSSWRLTKGSFIHFILKNPDLFIRTSKEYPDLTLRELARLEKELEKAHAEREK